MRYFRWTIFLVLLLTVFSFFHYNLPQRDIVRVTATDVIRADFTGWNRIFYAQADSGSSELVNRDLRLVFTSRENGRVSVYRNEDTGFGWPPYFKLDSSNLQAEAADLISTRAAPIWVAITHYGWRNEFLSIYPNAIAVREVSGPDVTLIPWVNIALLVLLLVAIFMIWRMLRRFRRRAIEPFLDRADDQLDLAKARYAGFTGGIRAWLDTWRKNPPRLK
jgi:hypothetical protein